jgi:hypothetical protein
MYILGSQLSCVFHIDLSTILTCLKLSKATWAAATSTTLNCIVVACDLVLVFFSLDCMELCMARYSYLLVLTDFEGPSIK